MASSDTYKILSLDGGGTWALLQVLTLKDIFEKKYPKKSIKGHELLRHFDMVIANSGGSMVLAALACNWSFDQIIAIFDDEATRHTIFKKLPFKDLYLPNSIFRLFGFKTFGARYSTTAKRKGLSDILRINGNKKLDSIPLTKLPSLVGKDSLEMIVTTFDIVNKRARFFRSNKKSLAMAENIAGSNDFDDVSLVEAIHGSSNAPINYFDFPAVFSPENSSKRFYLWDGALGGFNNPILAGITEAVANGVKRENIKVLSIGTASKIVSQEKINTFYKQYYNTLIGSKWLNGKFPYRFFKGKKFFTSIVSNLSKTILFEPHYWSTYAAYMFLLSDTNNNDFNIIRLSPQIVLNSKSDDLIMRLYNLDMDVTEQKDIDAIKICFERWKNGKIQNEPIQWDININRKYIFALGHKTYVEAIEDLNWI
jgi:patatin-like phospholipase/acyl hydrolase